MYYDNRKVTPDYFYNLEEKQENLQITKEMLVRCLNSEVEQSSNSSAKKKKKLWGPQDSLIP